MPNAVIFMALRPTPHIASERGVTGWRSPSANRHPVLPPPTASAGPDCDESNVASRNVIERNGGQRWDAGGKMLRFWVPARPTANPGPRVH
jgi:hypothetical protein